MLLLFKNFKLDRCTSSKERSLGAFLLDSPQNQQLDLSNFDGGVPRLLYQVDVSLDNSRQCFEALY